MRCVYDRLKRLDGEVMRHIISILLENEPGALSRVSGLFSARGYNIESLTVAPTNDATLSRMTIVTRGDDRKIDQIEKHLNKLVDVAALSDVSEAAHLESEVVLAKVRVSAEQSADLERIAQAFKATLSKVSDTTFILQMSGSSEKIDEMLRSLGSAEIAEVARSGVIGLSVSEEALKASII